MKYSVTLSAPCYYEFTVEAETEAEAYLKAHQAYEATSEERLNEALKGLGPPALEHVAIDGEESFS